MSECKSNVTPKWIKIVIGILICVSCGLNVQNTLNINKVSKNVDRICTKLEIIDDAVNASVNKIEAVESRIDKVDTRIGKVETKIDANLVTVNDKIDSNVKAVVSKIKVVNDKIDYFDTAKGNILSEMSALHNRIGVVSKKVTDTSNLLAANQGFLFKQDVSTIAKIKKMDAKISTLSEKQRHGFNFMARTLGKLSGQIINVNSTIKASLHEPLRQ